MGRSLQTVYFAKTRCTNERLEERETMTWIRTIPTAEADEKLRKAIEGEQSFYPKEYGVPVHPDDSGGASIVGSHTLIPEALYQLRYDPPGAPKLAERVAKLTGAAHDPHRGLDHGAWVPAMLAWPAADIPIFQLSIQPQESPAHHLALGRKLAALREEGVLVMGSGSATHNLRALVRGGQPAEPEPWAQAFDDWLAEAVAKGDEEALADYRGRAPYAREAHPTDEHFLPLHVAYGAAGEGARGKPLHRSFTLGNLSMASYAFD